MTREDRTRRGKATNTAAHFPFQNLDFVMIPPVYTKIATAYGEFALRQVPKVAKWGLPAAIFGMFSFA
jgi:hypothetical protein